jgi:hypothetical protein
MTTEGPLERFLRTDARDVGCDEAWALVHVYVEMVAAGDDPEARYPGVTAHLASCGPCAEDFGGLLVQLRGGFADEPAERRSP